jgi:hypothetical protein
MAQSIDFYIDVTNGTLIAAGSARNGSLPTFTRNDSYNFRVRLQERDTSGFLRDLDTTGSSVKLGIGGIDDGPTSGAFKLVINGVTSNAITYNADEATVASSIYTAVSNNVTTVTTYGNEPDAYILTATASNTAMSFGGSSFTLFPTTSVIINTRRFPAASIQAQQVIRLVRNPAVYSDTFVASPTAGIVSITKVQDGSATQNETYDLAIGSDAEGGSVILNYGANSTTAIAIGSNAASFSEALSAVTGIGSGNISVDTGNNSGNYSISFVRDLGLQNITTALTLDASGVIFGSFLQTVVTLATSELDELFAESGAETITPTIEIELTQGGTPKTVLQSPITVRRDLITTGSAIPAAQSSYLTSAESYAAFVRNSTTGVNSTAGGLADASAVTAVNYRSRTLNNSAGTTVLSYGAGLAFANTPMGFYGATVTAQPANINAVSGLINLGLLATGTTYGVLPQSKATVTTLASLAFGTVGANSATSITVAVTGATINDIVLLGIPSAVCEGLTFFGHVVANDQVHVDAVNATAGAKAQSTQTFRITTIDY